MENKKYLNIFYSAAFVLFALFFIPTTYAAYDCAVSYPGSDSVSPFTYNNCCYPAAAEPYQGIYCRPDNSVVRKIGSNPPLCSTYQEVLNLASSARSSNLAGFNCFDGTVDSTCRSGYCKNSSNSCVAISGVSCPAGLRRMQICPGGCGACNEDSVYCVNNIPTPIPSELTNPTLACIAKKDGSTYAPNSGKTCAQLGRDVKNSCTGECTECPVGTTPSGREVGVCKTYGERFLEILADGLAVLGGPNNDGRYDYSVTGPTAIKNIFVKSDTSEIAENLNWNNENLPQSIKWLLRNYNLCSTNADCTLPKMCSEGGYCYTPGATVGATCTGDSDCAIGYVCNNGTCSPSLTGTTVSPRFVGLTPSSYNGNRSGYLAANNLCKNGAGVLAGSHICNAQEMINTYNENKASLTGKTGMAWINNGPPGYVLYTTNDCSGWQTTNQTTFGSVWSFTSIANGVSTKMPMVAPCHQSIPFACCL